jgi:hypothetical protein
MRKILGLATPALIILSGILIVKYREDMVTWLTVGLGAIFFISGIISCVSYYIQRKHVLKMRAEGITLFDSEGKPVGQSMPTFPIVGVGSLILGVILASMPETFLNWLTYIFAAIILLVSVYQIADLIVANRYGRVGWAYWVMPIIMLLAAVVALVNPESISSSPLFFLGWAMIISGAVMIVNVLKIYTVRRAAEKRAADLAKKAESAAEVEVKEETDLIVKE